MCIQQNQVDVAMPFPDSAPRIPEGTRIYAIGDVHGRADPLEALLAEIDGRIGAAPVVLPEAPEPGADRYLAVVAEGGRRRHSLARLAEEEPTRGRPGRLHVRQ